LAGRILYFLVTHILAPTRGEENWKNHDKKELNKLHVLSFID